MDSWSFIRYAGGGIFFGVTMALVILRANRSSKTDNSFLSSLAKLRSLGWKIAGEKASGVVTNFHIHIFPGPGTKEQQLLHILVATEPKKGQLDFIKSQSETYFLQGTQPGFSYVGFRVLPSESEDKSDEILSRAEQLITLLQEKEIQPYRY